jgi:ABC-type oligopeptide transport system ATPase subunit
MSEPILSVRDLKKHFPLRRGVVHAVDGVSFDIGEGENARARRGIGCGKSTTGRLVIRLIDPTDGSVRFRGRDIATASKHELRDLTKEMQIIFQDPYSSIDPRKSIGETIGKPLEIHHVGNGGSARRPSIT